MKKWLPSILIGVVTTMAVISQVGAQEVPCNPNKKICKNGGGEVPFPFSVPFPWESIQGVWTNPEKEVSFHFRIVHYGTDYNIVTITELDSEGEVVAQGDGVGQIETQKVLAYIKNKEGQKWYVTAGAYKAQKDAELLVLQVTKETDDRSAKPEVIILQKVK